MSQIGENMFVLKRKAEYHYWCGKHNYSYAEKVEKAKVFNTIHELLNEVVG